MKNLLLSLFSGLFFSALSAQIIVPIETTNSFELTTCQNLLITANPYSGSTVQSINVLISDTSSYTAILNPTYFPQEWDLDSASELRFYDGFESSANLLGAYNSTTHPNGFLIDIETDSLRVEFETADGSAGNGFGLYILCNETFQTLPTAKFKPQLSENWYFDEDENMYALRSCLNDSIHLALDPVFLNPGLENQNADSVLIKWALGDRSFKREKGLTSINHVYTEGSGYLVTVYSQDTLGAESYLKFMVRNSPTPTYSVNTDQPFCLNEPSEVEGGMNGDVVVGAEAGFGATSITEFYGTAIYLPDGDGENYTTTIEVSGFPEGTTISSASDMAALCINMEHSYLGDLEMMLTCPDGTDINIFNSYAGDGLFEGGFGGGGTYLGDANDGNDFLIPGMGFDYCFSDDAEWGTLGDEFGLGNTVQVSTFQNGNAMSPGTYLPEESFENFIGCPANGEWILTVRDNIYFDDGYIFDWSLGFSEDLSNSGFQNELVAAIWEPNSWISSVNEGSVEITPQSAEAQQVTFTVTDENGCNFSRDLTIQISDTLTTLNDSLICNLAYNLQWPTSLGELNFISGPSSDVTISNSGEIFEIEVPEAGNYTFELNYFDCSSAALANLVFLEEDNPACITGINDIDFIKEFTIAPNPASNYAEVKFEIKKAQEVQITISTLDGKVVSKEKYHFTTGDQNRRVNLDKFESGAYLITLLGETFKASGLLIKQ
ncbi:T9SS type A sorting domain-containing protein [Cryomorpha ignava]|uniref:T9SS type A sorting domain-containing protein n=1 Tax=Cryomorpha ignava TaxID=101383 RepID=A0A7K3WR16_9FLAO|nr:T9SS type A sorting domain-containing protein [Cryomorpha ignava]NEN24120.1 T9SS type A sorting domain-containing protein [Cryomorpha ignava]